MTIWSSARRSITITKPSDDPRIPHQHDYDRLLFSTPVRRLADKTQVFPLDANDSVRTRLTHSHEVANLARSIGLRLISNGTSLADPKEAPGAVAAILSTVGLGHDVGNPPFGHQGEASIGRWFDQNIHLFDDGEGDVVPQHLRPEFAAFEGNAQSLRLVARLQVSAGFVGLDFTAGTLSALMKYTVPCDARSGGSASTKKYGYFESEHTIVEWIRRETGLREGERHPLTWIMEAADDTAYSVLDIEDAMKKRIMSPDDVLSIIEDNSSNLECIEIKNRLKEDFGKISHSDRSVSEVREVKSSYVRTNLIRHLISHAVSAFEENWEAIEAYRHTQPLLEGCGLCELLKKVAFTYAFSSSSVRQIEADGAIAIHGLMDFFWSAISQRENERLGSRRVTAQAAYGWSLISDNYRQIAERGAYLDRNREPLPLRYRELRLLTDMIAGMTDGFATSLFRRLREAGHIT